MDAPPPACRCRHKGESPINRAGSNSLDRAADVPGKLKRSRMPQSAKTRQSRSDRLRECDVRGLTLKHYIERKTDRF